MLGLTKSCFFQISYVGQSQPDCRHEYDHIQMFIHWMETCSGFSVVWYAHFSNILRTHLFFRQIPARFFFESGFIHPSNYFQWVNCTHLLKILIRFRVTGQFPIRRSSDKVNKLLIIHSFHFYLWSYSTYPQKIWLKP